MIVHAQAQIPGCRLGNEINNHRGSHPSQTVRIRLSSLATCEAVAELYSYIAYPDPLDAVRRQEFSIALARWAVMERAFLDNSFNDCADMKPSIRPIVFSQPDSLFLKVHARGARILRRRLVFALMILQPRGLDEMDGFLPSVRNVAVAAAAKLGFKEGSVKTIEAQVWGPMKPVVHVAAAAMESMAMFDVCREHQDYSLWDADTYPLCYGEPMLATLFYDDIVRKQILPMAELYRLQLPSCERFKIRDEQTICFVAD